MRALHHSFLLLSLVLLAACSGPDAARKPPEHLQAGHKEIKKGAAWFQRGCYNRSLEHFFRAHELFTASDQAAGVALSLNNIGNVYRAVGDTDAALLFFDASAGAYRTIHDGDGEIRALTGKAAALIAADRLDQAAGVLASVETLVGDADAAPPMYLNARGILHFRRKEFGLAEAFLNQALDKTPASDAALRATVSHALGALMRETDRREEALRHFETALAADRRAGFYQGVAGDLAAIGKIQARLDRHEAAAEAFSRCIQVYAWLGNKEKVMEILDLLETSARAAGVNTQVTLHFVNQWLKGEQLEPPCQ